MCINQRSVLSDLLGKNETRLILPTTENIMKSENVENYMSNYAPMSILKVKVCSFNKKKRNIVQFVNLKKDVHHI